VVVASVILVLGGTLAAFSASRSAGGCAVVLAAMVLAYNAGLKPVPVLGALTMGLCRGLSLVMGALAAGYPGFVDAQGVAVLTAAAGMVLYVAGLSGVARRETETVSPGGLRWVPALVVGAWMGLSWVPGLLVQVPSVWILGVALAWCTYVGMTLNGQPSPVKVGAAVGAWVRGLLFLQAAVVFMVSPVGEWVGAGLLMVGWPLHAWLSRRFYAS
jgi:4-hydroxybenzoate polyprenyltransferase